MRSALWRLVCTFLACEILFGCGGGQSTPSNSGAGRAVIKITWPDRSRLIPAASNSIRLAFIRSNAEIASKIVPRPASGNQTSTTFQDLKTGSLSMTAVAFPNVNATGVPQASGTTPVTIASGQTGNISLTMASTIDHIELAPTNPTIKVGNTKQLTATAKNLSGSVVLM